MRPPEISDLRLTAARGDDVERGLLAYLRFVVDELLVLDSVVLRRTSEGRLALSWPERRDASGRTHPIVRPMSDEARQAIEDRVFIALALDPARLP